MIDFGSDKWSITAGDFCDDIQAGRIFSFTRWGDGEWTALLGRTSPRNCDGHPYSPELTVALRHSLMTPGPRVGIASCVSDMFGRDASELLSDLEIMSEWYDANIFHVEEWKAYEERRSSRLLQTFREQKGFLSTLIVGPDCYSRLADLYPVDGFVEVPRMACFEQAARICLEIREAVANLPKPVLVSVSASMAANVIIHRLYADLHKQAWLIDLGSVWLPYIPNHGLRLRSGQRGKVPIV